LTDDRWREVFLLVAGLMPTGANSLLQQMEKEIEKFINTEKLRALVAWAKTETANSADNYNSVAKRSVALALALALARVLARARTLDLALAFARVLAHTLALALVLARACDFALALARARALALDLDLARDLARDLALALTEAKIFNSVDFAALIGQLESIENNVPNNCAPVEEHQAFVDHLQQSWYDALHLDRRWLDLSNEEKRSLEDYLYANELMIRCKEAAVRVSPQVWDAIESRMLTIHDNESNS
jgi:hypothetical protein